MPKSGEQQRRLAGALLPRLALAALSALAVLLCARFAVAHWLVFSPDVPGAEPTEDAASLERAYRLAPGDRLLTSWQAQQALEGFRRGWLTASARELGEGAIEAAHEAVAAAPADPFTHVLLGAARLDFARHPRTENGHAQALVGEAMTAFRRAMALWPTSPDLGLRIESILLERWSQLDDAGRETLTAAVRQVGMTSSRAYPGALGRLRERAERSGADAVTLVAMLDQATPADNGLAQLERATESRRLAMDTANEAEREVFVRSMLEAGLRAVEISGFDPAASEVWIRDWTRHAPDRATEGWARARQLTDEHPQAAGAWLLRSRLAVLARERGDALDSCTRASRLAADVKEGATADRAAEACRQATAMPEDRS